MSLSPSKTTGPGLIRPSCLTCLSASVKEMAQPRARMVALDLDWRLFVIWWNREDGQGAVFTIRLPLPSGELRSEMLPGAASQLRESAGERPNLDGINILIVDDETDALDLITVELAQHGAQVTAVTNAEDALKALAEKNFEVLISDIGMPKTDGYELMRQIRQQENSTGKRIPAVALTAYARVQDRMQAILAGFSTHIAKPVDANELVTVVASLAGRWNNSGPA